jgi:2-polyprenyl-3-methyl-5-hydroxy-6-metoxy-1,4-benzoquinol methylase
VVEPLRKGAAVLATDVRWNHNIHYHLLILAAVPPGCRTALDVGCGEGTLTREPRAVVPSITGIDLDARSLELARRHPDRNGVEYVRGDFLTHPFEPESFDMVVSVAALHHMDAEAALDRMRALLGPGGVLALVGLARDRFPRDLPLALAGMVTHRWHRWRKGYWQHPAPALAILPAVDPARCKIAGRGAGTTDLTAEPPRAAIMPPGQGPSGSPRSRRTGAG